MTLCSHCSSENIQKRGFFYLKHSSKYVQRYFCRDCKKSFSPRTFALDAYQHKPFLNDLIKKLLCEGSSMRSLSRVFQVTYATIYRKFLFLSEYSIKKTTLEPRVHVERNRDTGGQHAKTHLFSVSSKSDTRAYSIQVSNMRPTPPPCGFQVMPSFISSLRRSLSWNTRTHT